MDGLENIKSQRIERRGPKTDNRSPRNATKRNESKTRESLFRRTLERSPNAVGIAYGCRRAGKTQIARALLLERGIGLRRWADVVFVFCQSINRKAYESCGIEGQYIYHAYQEEIIKKIIQTQEELVEKGVEKLKILVIIDDCLGSRKEKSKNINGENGIEYLFSVGRHYNIHTIVLTQSMKFVSQLYQNSDYIFAFPRSIRMKRDKEEFKKEIMSNYTDDFSDFDNCKQHEFLFIHLTADEDDWEKLSCVNKIDKRIVDYSIYNDGLNKL